MKKKRFNHDLTRGKEKIINVSIDCDGLRMKSYGKDWAILFATGSYECGLFSYLAEKKDFKSIDYLARMAHMSRMVLKDVSIADMLYKAIDAKMNPKTPKVSKKKDKVVLAEEKVLSEKTEESVDELEKLKK